MFKRKKRHSSKRNSFVEKLRRPLSWVIALLFIWTLAYTTAPKSLPMAIAFETLGLLMVVVGTMGRLWCTLHIAGHKDTNLKTDGAYSVSRNPLYFFSFLAVVGVALFSMKGMLALIVACVYIVFYSFVIVDEERRLKTFFGQAFEDYLKRVPRFWPNFKNYNSPEMVSVDPRLMVRSGTDMMWFFVVLAMISAFGHLQTAGVLRPVFVWPF